MKLVYIDDSGQRLDVFLQTEFIELSRTSIQKLINSEKVLVNGNSEKTGYKLKMGDIISVDYKKPTENEMPTIDLPIIYEDEDCIVIDKPVGILTHSKGSFNPEATVASFITPKLSDLKGERAGIVHRLDRATSGVIICAKNQQALSWLQKQFATRKTKKIYFAVIKNGLEPTQAIIDMPIERDPKLPKQFRVGKNGKTAQTAYKIINQNNEYALIELKPVTGRTHQLRVHLKQVGYPIIGDTIYGGLPAERLMLHAENLELTLPNRLRKTFNSIIPKTFTRMTQ